MTALQAAQASTTPTYTINPGDEVEVYVWGDPRLQRSMKVLPDGSFSFPLVGRVVVQGLTAPEVEAEISKGLASQYHGEPPQVMVSVPSTAGFSFSVIGRVKNAGTFSPSRYINVLEAITMAGGPADFANLDKVLLIRKTDKGLTAERVRLEDAMKGNLSGSDASSIPQIKAGDMVIVP